jgi:hypothetical protein
VEEVALPLRDVLAQKVPGGERKYIILLHKTGRECALASTWFAEHQHTQDLALDADVELEIERVVEMGAIRIEGGRANK